MKRSVFRRTVLLVLVLAMLLSNMSMLVFAADNSSVTVTVSEDKIVIHIEKVATTGTAQLYRFDADSYYSADSLRGLSGKTEGEVVGDYTCGTSADITIDRYAADGTDRLYSKFYLIRSSKILAGPVYATEIASERSVKPFAMATKKGLTLEDDSTIEFAKDLGASNTVINMDLCSLILANEDKNGNPIDYSGRTDVIPFESNGKTFYFSKDYVNAQRSLISAYSKEGMNVILVVIAWMKTYRSTYPSDLLYVAVKENRQTMAFNTSSERGAQYWIAAMEFMANEYSQDAEHGLVHKFVIGNEIDYAYDWNLMQSNQDANGKYQRLPMDTYMEEYTRTLRLANMAVKKYNSEAKVLVSFTQSWARNCYDCYNMTGESIRYNSYAPKDMLDWMNDHEKARGDYDWGLALHPYPIGHYSSKPTVTDLTYSGKTNVASPITGDFNTTPWVTPANMEVYQLYLEQPQARYNGQVRSVSLTESGICSSDETKVSAEEYERSLNEQAASIAQYYYRASMLDCIEEFAYFHLTDRPTVKIGLRTADGTKKPAYNVWKFIDTTEGERYANEYLEYIDKDAASYRDVMEIVKSNFDWDERWDASKVTGTKAPVEKNVERLAGKDRFDTAFKVADQMKQTLGIEKFDTIIIASGLEFADALAGSYLAAVKDAPILLSYKAKQNALAQEYIKANLAEGGTVYILGGTNAVPETMEEGLEGLNVKRLAGENRFETNLLILKEAGVKTGDEILVCTGKEFADSLSGSATGQPILLVYKKLTDSQKEYLASLNGNKFCVVGGENAVPASLETAIKDYGETIRLAGKDRLVTSIMVAQRYFDNPESMVVAYGWNFPDGLCGGALAYSMDAPLILTHSKTKLYAVAAEYGFDIACFNGAVLGGEGLVSDAAVRAIFGMDANDPIVVK